MLDKASVIGLIMGMVCVFGGGVLEGLPLSAILHMTPFIIVILGALAAMLLTTPVETLSLGTKMVRDIFVFDGGQVKLYADMVISYAEMARRESILALEKEVEKVPHPFLKKALRYAVDGYDPDTIGDLLETEISIIEERETNAGKMFEAAGGYAPTIGIIGAVLGLIKVMQGLAGEGGTAELGEGIAVAFVATIYGVGSANLIFIPFGGKLKSRAAANKQLKKMMLSGILGIVQGLNPRVIQERMKIYYE